MVGRNLWTLLPGDMRRDDNRNARISLHQPHPRNLHPPTRRTTSRSASPPPRRHIMACPNQSVLVRLVRHSTNTLDLWNHRRGSVRTEPYPPLPRHHLISDRLLRSIRGECISSECGPSGSFWCCVSAFRDGHVPISGGGMGDERACFRGAGYGSVALDVLSVWASYSS